ncbi:UNVERIFIED_CONTAM: hypothetical protein GTU68_035510 [Idotea baltica]|nr:hypothetical protein [Idotea baltica]
MTLDIYQVDAFTSKLFGGNPAAIIPLSEWLSSELMQKIAEENNLSETAYFVKEVYDSEGQIADLDPNFAALKKIKSRGIICTAIGLKVDFVSRFFAPAAGINEDPVTGSAHTALIPYWAKKLAKNSLYAEQISKRKGELHCQFIGDRVLIAGKAISYLQGKINI